MAPRTLTQAPRGWVLVLPHCISITQLTACPEKALSDYLLNKGRNVFFPDRRAFAVL